jgi:hypothetical protein
MKIRVFTKCERSMLRPGTNVGCVVGLRILPLRLIYYFFLIFFSFSFLFLIPFSIKNMNTSFSIIEHTNHISHNHIQLIYISQIIRFTTYLRTQDSQTLHISQKSISQSLKNHNQSQEHQKIKTIPYLCFPISPQRLSSACSAAPAAYLPVSRQRLRPLASPDACRRLPGYHTRSGL